MSTNFKGDEEYMGPEFNKVATLTLEWMHNQSIIKPSFPKSNS